MRDSANKLKVTPEEVPERIAALQRQVKEAKSAKRSQSKGDVEGALGIVSASLVETAGVQWAAVKIEGLDMQGLRDLSARVKSLGGDLAVALVGVSGESVPFMVLSQGAALERGLAAGKLAEEFGGHVGGGGGGRNDAGQGQGSKPEAVDEALEWVSGRIQETLGA